MNFYDATINKPNVESIFGEEISFCFFVSFWIFQKSLEEKNEQTKVYDHGGQATRGQKVDC